MIFIFPLVPILIAIVVLALSLMSKAAETVDTITTVLWVIVIVVSIVLVLYSLFRKASASNKIMGAIISVSATAITMNISSNFLFGLADSSDSILEFGFVLVFGGIIWLSSVGMSSYAAYLGASCEGGEDSFKAIGYIIGTLLLSGFFGLLG